MHDRRPLEGFTGCPCLTELLSILGFEDVSKKALILSEESGGGDGFIESGIDGSQGLVDGFSDYFVWNTPSVVSLDDLIVSNSAHNFQAMGVPPLPKVYFLTSLNLVVFISSGSQTENLNFATEMGVSSRFLGLFDSLQPSFLNLVYKKKSFLNLK